MRYSRLRTALRRGVGRRDRDALKERNNNASVLCLKISGEEKSTHSSLASLVSSLDGLLQVGGVRACVVDALRRLIEERVVRAEAGEVDDVAAVEVGVRNAVVRAGCYMRPGQTWEEYLREGGCKDAPG